MDQAQIFRMQQDQYDQAASQVAQVADLKATFLSKRVRPKVVGILTDKHKKKFQDQEGTVIGITVPDYEHGIIAGLHILWDDGEESKSLPYMVTLA